jgi:hypothetical protein
MLATCGSALRFLGSGVLLCGLAERAMIGFELAVSVRRSVWDKFHSFLNGASVTMRHFDFV